MCASSEQCVEYYVRLEFKERPGGMRSGAVLLKLGLAEPQGAAADCGRGVDSSSGVRSLGWD